MPERIPQAARVEGKAAPPANTAALTALLLRGRGERKITVEFTLPVVARNGFEPRANQASVGGCEQFRF